MKKFFILILALTLLCGVGTSPVFVSTSLAFKQKRETELPDQKSTNKPCMAIVIDDFGGYERSGVRELLESKVPITCAIMPFVDNSKIDYEQACSAQKEVILHMPMQAHVNLPESWYGPVYIANHDAPEVATKKLQKCFETMPNAKGFNIHIGSGVSRNEQIMEAMYNYANKNDIMFLDSRTNSGDKCEEASQITNSIYLGRDVFLEPHKNRSYSGVISRLAEARKIADEKGYAIVIGHVGAEGGINTARAIIDFYNDYHDYVNFVPLSAIYKMVKEAQFK